jgi:hypothetical protein
VQDEEQRQPAKTWQAEAPFAPALDPAELQPNSEPERAREPVQRAEPPAPREDARPSAPARALPEKKAERLEREQVGTVRAKQAEGATLDAGPAPAARKAVEKGDRGPGPTPTAESSLPPTGPTVDEARQRRVGEHEELGGLLLQDQAVAVDADRDRRIAEAPQRKAPAVVELPIGLVLPGALRSVETGEEWRRLLAGPYGTALALLGPPQPGRRLLLVGARRGLVCDGLRLSIEADRYRIAFEPGAETGTPARGGCALTLPLDARTVSVDEPD